MLNGIISTRLAHLRQRVAELRRWQAARRAATAAAAVMSNT